MTCDFTSFLPVFQSYQDNAWMIMKGSVEWTSIMERFPPQVGLKFGTARAMGQSYWASNLI